MQTSPSPSSTCSPELVRARANIERWRKGGPTLYAIENLGVPERWNGKTGVLDWQYEASAKLVERDRLSVRSGHGVGKSAFLSWAVIWFLNCYFPAKIPVTAPTGHQLSDILWAEIAKWHRILKERKPALAAQFEWKTEVFELKAAPRESFAVARTSRKENPEALQGFHSENLLFLIDEASGVDEAIYEVAEGALSTDGAKVILTGNPTRTSGYFHDTHHRGRADWGIVHVNGETCPLVSKRYIDTMARKYGIESNRYRVRVLGEFPKSEDDVVIPLDLIEAAELREAAPIENIMPVWGLDVARFGNCRTALCKRRSTVVLEQKYWAKRDTMEVAGLIVAEYEDTKSDERPAQILVDSIGIGAGVVDRLSELGLPVTGINVGEQPAGRQRFINLRAELYWRAREWFEDRNCSLAACKSDEREELAGELSIVKYKFTSTGKIQIESKEQMMERGVESPDLADSFVLTFAGADRRKSAHDRYTRAKPKRSGSAWTS